jgi:hypothetical protein
VSSQQIKDYASELQGLTNFGDEATISAAALLATFTNVRDDVFLASIPLIQDVATAMGQDLNQSTIQVGKALNDPIEGLSALRRVGIQFSDEQERQIKNFVELNDIASAQGVILAELQRQFGGSAEAAREAEGNFTALANAFGDLKEQIGDVIKNLDEAAGATDLLLNTTNKITGVIAELQFDVGLAEGLEAELAATRNELDDLVTLRNQLAQRAEDPGLIASLLGFDATEQLAEFDTEIAKVEAKIRDIIGAIEAEEQAVIETTGAIQENTNALEDNEESLKAVESALKRAESLQLSFARAAEDAARKQQRATDKLNRSQFKERVEFLNKQANEFDKFQADEIKSVQEAEKKLNDARAKAGEERLRDRDKLHRRLRQAEDRFNLSRLQGERRFSLDDRRLRAEGDILGLQELRENFALEQQENQENFDLQQRQTQDNGKEQEKERENQRKEQIQALEDELSGIQDNLDERRNEFLVAQEKEFQDLLRGQEEQRSELQRQFLEQEEDRRISQQRQLEDLGRSLAEQQDLTAEGAARIAEELETVFGMEGVADNIMSGFTARTESEFRGLFEEITGIVEETQQRMEESAQAGRTRFSGEFGLGGGTGRELDPFRPLAFDDGGIVPGPRGAPQSAIVHGGETILPTHRMSVPIIPSQNLNVVASGRISVEGSGSIDEAALVQVEDRIADSMEIAIKRMARRG